MIGATKIRFMIQGNKPRKIYKKQFYEAIPYFHKPHDVDIHDGYTYRKRSEVMSELKNLKIAITVTRHVYPETDPYWHVKNRKVLAS